MEISLIDGVRTLSLDLIATVTLSVLVLLFGNFAKRKISIFDRFCIPAPVIGGFSFAIIAFILKSIGILEFSMDTTMQTPLMIAFFTIVGFGGSLNLLKKGGVIIIIYWILSVILSIVQNVIGVSVAKLTGIEPILGIMSGAVSMVGGHGGAAAFGESAEMMGYAGASTMALAAATFGLISGSLLGGPVANFLITKNNLKPIKNNNYEDSGEEVETHNTINYEDTMKNLAVLLVTMVVGMIVGKYITILIGNLTNRDDIVLPSYVGAMLVAVIVRNVNDKYKFFDIQMPIMDLFSDISLGIFLSMALMTLKLWELRDLAGPMFIILICQLIFIVLYTVLIVFNLCGRDYDAAVMVSGMLGHGLGATPNAVANMSSVESKYGPSPKAFLIVPLVGSFLVDIINIPSIVIFMNIFR